MKYILTSFFCFILFFFSSFGFSIDDQNWDFSNSQRWIGETAEGLVEYCQAKSHRWTVPLVGFDINKDSVDDFLFGIGCYQEDRLSDEKQNIRVRAAWKMYCSKDGTHIDCTEDLFGTKVIEVTASDPDAPLGSDGGGNPYFQVSEIPRDLNNDGYPEFWYAVNRDDGRSGFDINNDEDRALLLQYCGPQPQTGEERYLWDCTRKSIQTMLISNPDGTYDIKSLPWGPQNTQAILVLPNSIGTFDLWAMIYGPHKVARYTNGDFIDVTSEYEQDPNWQAVTTGGGPYAKAFAHEDSFYIARADIPKANRPTWATEVYNSGFMLWKYDLDQGFTLSDVYTPNESQTFFYKLQTEDSIETRFGAVMNDVPVFDPRWHFFDLEILDDSNEPILIVQSESFSQLGNAFKANHDSNITYSIGDSYEEQNTSSTIWASANAVQGFYIRDGRLIERSRPVIEGTGLYDVAYKRFTDINSDGFTDMIGVSGGTERPSVFLNDTEGTLVKQFLGDIFPNLSNDSSYWESADWYAGHGSLLYPFYSESKIDILYWTKGYVWNIPSYLGEDYVFSPGDIVLAHGKTDVTSLKGFSPNEQQTLLENCLSNGLMKRDGYQVPCNIGTPFPNDSEIDSDGDGVVDSQDDLRFDAAESIDTDNDGIGNNEDADDDNDGVDDFSDAFPLDDTETTDFDADGIGDNEDTDDDNDGVPDANDSYPYNGNHDSDGDGVNNSEDAFPQNNLYSSDSDQDGMPDIWERLYGLDPNDASDAMSDEDLDGASARAEFLANVIPSFSLDIDSNGRFDALTDGLLVLRSLFGLSDDSLIAGALAADASVTDSQTILSKVSALGSRLDIDKNGSLDALTDGLIILRYLFGLRGDAMTSNVLANDADRTDIAELEGYLKGISSSNLQAPMFLTSAEYRVTEGQIEIGQILTTDADSDDNLITFSIDSDEILVSSDGGLTFVEAPDIETKPTYSAVVTASDGENSSSQQIKISIKYKYEYADHWDSHSENLDKIRGVYTNEIGFKLDEIWFKTLSIPKNKFATTRFDYFLEEPHLSGAVGVGTWFTKNEKTFYFHCNWSPFAPNQGGIKIFEYSNGEFAQFIYKSVQGCNHPFSIKNKDGTSQIVFLALDEGKSLIDEENVGKTYTFDMDTYEFFELEPEFGSHGQSVFDYEQDGDLDIISNDFGNTVSDAQPFILRNDGINDFEIVKVPQIDYTPGGPYYYSEMSASAFYSGDLLNVVYTDFNIGRKVENEWGIELNKNVIVSYEKESFEIVNVSQLPSPYSEENFSNIEPYNQGFLNGNGISHDVRSNPIDIDYDGDIDIIIGSQVYGETISLPQILINNNGVYEDETSSRLFNWMYATGSMHRWDFADVNDDGYLDIVTKDGCIGIFQDQDGQIIEVDKQYGCERKVAINDGTGHFLAIIEPTQIMQIFEGNEFKFYRVHPIFAMDADRNLSWIGLDGYNCNGCYADGNWEIFHTKLEKPISTGPAGMDPSIVGEPGFNEFYYLLHYPDVRDAVQNGFYENGLEHYLAAGKDLGYFPNAKSLTNVVVEEYGVNPAYTIN